MFGDLHNGGLVIDAEHSFGTLRMSAITIKTTQIHYKNALFFDEIKEFRQELKEDADIFIIVFIVSVLNCDFFVAIEIVYGVVIPIIHEAIKYDPSAAM